MSKISAKGLVCTTPRYLFTIDEVSILSFRLAETSENIDPRTGKVDSDSTNWYTITMFGRAAINGRDSIKKGDRVFVSGDLKIRDWDNGERTGTSVEIIADSVGHDLTYGTTVFTRTQLVQNTTEEKPQHKCSCTGCGRNR